jgi:hypothetical protein
MFVVSACSISEICTLCPGRRLVHAESDPTERNLGRRIFVGMGSKLSIGLGSEN